LAPVGEGGISKKEASAGLRRQVIDEPSRAQGYGACFQERRELAEIGQFGRSKIGVELS
jgi:hypothetical protein